MITSTLVQTTVMARQILIGILLFFICVADGRTVTQDHQNPDHDTLKLIHVVFRHGNRTQDGSYPTDPYQNDTFYPIGEGHLTNAGKLWEYNIGTYLREAYNSFIPMTYSPGVISALSSYVPRCKASLQLVLAGLFPPTDILQWNTNFNWQPIPYDYVDSTDKLFWAYTNCPQYATYSEVYRASTTYQDIYAPYQETITYLKNNSGITSSGLDIGSSLFSTLRSQSDLGLTLPAWTDAVWPEPITTLTKFDWQQLFATEETRALGAGFLLSKIINDTELTLNGDSSVDDLKAYLYSGHDTNIAAVLSWLGTPDLHVPQYGSFVVFEIHIVNNVPLVKVIHQNYEYEIPQNIFIPKCGYECPLATFIQLYAQYTNPYDICS